MVNSAQSFLSEKDKKNLLGLARKVLEDILISHLPSGRSGWIESLQSSYPIKNNPSVGVFVTLKKSGHLRGCIGTIHAETPLFESIIRMTIQSAFHDPRFPPLSPEELQKTAIEISVLSPMKKAESADEIIPYQHGVYVKKGNHSGVFLPQVWEQLPDKKEFLNELCVSKAGLSPDAYKDTETEIYLFTVDHFEE